MNKTKAKRMFENARREIIKAQESSVEAMNATQGVAGGRLTRCTNR